MNFYFTATQGTMLNTKGSRQKMYDGLPNTAAASLNSMYEILALSAGRRRAGHLQ
jgi:hypothetical protein